MKSSLRKLLVALGACALVAGQVSAQSNFVYTNNNVFGPNTVSGYSVGDDGSLTNVPGSPFSTFGIGTGAGFFASSRITSCIVGNFLYVGNDGSDDITAFSIDADTGELTLVPGTPIDTGGAGGSGISLAATPDNRFLFAGNALSQTISIFAVNPDGSLTSTQAPLFAFGQPNGVKVTPDGRFLVAVLANVGPHGSIMVFSIDSDGNLTPQLPQPVRPFGGPDGNAAGVDIACDSTTVAVGEATAVTLVDVFTLDHDSGILTPVPGSPFRGGAGVNSNVPLFNVDDSLLFVSNQGNNMLTSFGVDPEDRHLSLIGTFPGGPGGPTLGGMAVSADGAFLYAAKFPNVVSAFGISSDGSLAVTGTAMVSAPQRVGLESLAAFPPKTCPGPAAVAGARR